MVTPTSVDESRSRVVSLAGGLDVPTLLQAVGDPTRWQILQHLADAELCTTHLQELLHAKQAVMSHHLKVLREAGLVATEPCGRFTYYRLQPGALDRLGEVVADLAAASRRTPARKAC